MQVIIVTDWRLATADFHFALQCHFVGVMRFLQIESGILDGTDGFAHLRRIILYGGLFAVCTAIVGVGQFDQTIHVGDN